MFLLTVPRRCFFCGSILLFVFRVCCVFLSVHCSLVVSCWEKTDLLARLCVMFYCAFVFSHVTVVFWVSCGVWLYRFLIVAFFLLLFFYKVYEDMQGLRSNDGLDLKLSSRVSVKWLYSVGPITAQLVLSLPLWLSVNQRSFTLLLRHFDFL